MSTEESDFVSCKENRSFNSHLVQELRMYRATPRAQPQMGIGTFQEVPERFSVRELFPLP
jgi:hypothetical protein